MSQKFGIDVSHWQGDFNFARAKSNEGVEFAIANIERAIKDVIDPEQNYGEGDGLRTNVS